MNPKSLSRRIPAFALRPLSAAIATAAALGMAPPASNSASINWTGSGGPSNLWGDAANWDAGVPGAADAATVFSGGVALNGTQSVSSLALGQGSTSTLMFQVGSHLTTDSFVLGAGAGAIATATLSSGASATFWTTREGTIAGAAGSTAEMSLAGVGSMLEATSLLYVGEYGNGFLNIRDGARAYAYDALLVGRAQDASGSVLVSGAGSQLVVGSLAIGGDLFGLPSTTARGEVTVVAGASVFASALSIGEAARATGTLRVDGAGSTLVTPGTTYVGNYGTGTAIISNAGRVESGGIKVGEQTGSSGMMVLTDAGTSWISSGPIEVGTLGTGNVSVSAGATLRGTSGWVGVQAGGDNVASITGPGSSWDNSGIFVVGDRTGARGAVVLLGGGRLTSMDGTLGRMAGSYGTMTIMSSGSNWTATGPVTIGDAGEGRIVLVDGARLSANEVVIAKAAGSTGTLALGTPRGFMPAPAGVLNAPVLRFGAGNGELLFNFVGPALTYGGRIEGNGRVNIAAGDVILTGNSGNTGLTTVSGGSLSVNGTLAGPVSVGAGGTLAGSGSVGATTLASGSTLSPGNSIGTLTVNGDLSFAPGSTYRVEAAPGSTDSDRVVVNGIAHLAGSVVHVGPEDGFASARRYTILRANTLQGQFGTVSSNFAYLDPKLSYSAHDVTLELARKMKPVDPSTTPPVTPSRPMTFADAAQTNNQRATANGLESLAPGNPLHEFILTLPTGAPPAVFDSLSGEIHASVSSSLTGAGATTRTLPLAHLRGNLAAGMQPGAPTAQAGGMPSASALPNSNTKPAWAELVGNWQTLGGNGNAAKTTQSTGGLFVGADHAVGDGWRVGAALGYTDGNIRVDDRNSKADVSSYSAALYGGKSFDVGAGTLNLLAGTSYTWHNIDSQRNATVAGTSQKLTADYGANTTQLFTELGYAMALSDRASLEPFAGLAWSDIRTRGFSESGGSAALSGQSASDKQTNTTLGVRAQTAFTLGQTEGTLRATLGWRHAFGEVTPQSTMAFDGGQAFTVAGASIARNAALAELGADLAISRNATVGLNYSGQYGGGNREHAGSVNVRWRY